MPNEAKRLRPVQIQADKNAFAALQAIAGYAPANQAFAITAITAASNALAAAQQAEAQAAAAAAAARDVATASEWAFHNLMLGAKDQIRAQFGKDSTEVQSVGLKRRSEYSRPKPRAKSDDAQA
jgi:hypothetical protein